PGLLERSGDPGPGRFPDRSAQEPEVERDQHRLASPDPPESAQHGLRQAGAFRSAAELLLVAGPVERPARSGLLLRGREFGEVLADLRQHLPGRPVISHVATPSSGPCRARCAAARPRTAPRAAACAGSASSPRAGPALPRWPAGPARARPK